MTNAPTTELPTLAAEPTCPSCDAAMAGDQRYCLRCGERRGAPRVSLPTATMAPPTVPAAPLAAPIGPPRNATAIWVGAVGVLLLAMGVGVLIGHAGRTATPPTSAAAPVTVTVPAGAAAAAPAVTASPAAAAKGKKKAAAKTATAPATETSKAELQQLDDLSPEEYSKKSKSLPDTVGTAGTPAPKDDKAAGAGSDTETIGG